MQNYDYTTAGFDPFLTRSIDGFNTPNLDALGATTSSSEVNYDQSQVTGSLGNAIQVGNIRIDGVTGRITIYDQNGNEAIWIGNIDGS